LASRPSPPQAYLAYDVKVLWALTGIVVNQYDASVVTTGVAVAAAVPVVMALRANRRRGGTSEDSRRGVEPRVV
jgi:hypothetical protein